MSDARDLSGTTTSQRRFDDGQVGVRSGLSGAHRL
jgi:hypothetical protein